MYLWTVEYKGVKSYIVPTYHFNINLLFTKNELESFTKLIENSDMVYFESNVKKPNNDTKYSLKKIYNTETLKDIVDLINNVFKPLEYVDVKNIENKGIMTLTAGPGIGLLTSKEFNDAMDMYLNSIAKLKNKTVKYLDDGKEYKKTIKNLASMVEKMKEHLALNPPKIQDISKNIKLSKKSCNDYKKLFTKSSGITKKKQLNKTQLLDKRNEIWSEKIANQIMTNKSIVAFVGSNHIDTSVRNNLIELLRNKYDLAFSKQLVHV